MIPDWKKLGAMCKVIGMRLSEILPPRPADKPYSCVELARRIGKHPNTLRKYEAWGFIRPVPRRPNNYRSYDRVRALEALFAATVMRASFKDWRDHRRMKALLRSMRTGEYAAARIQIRAHRRILREWLSAALDAREILRSWRRKRRGPRRGPALSRPQAAAKIGVAPDTLRDWERNGLISPVRLANKRRRYPPEIQEQLGVIRVLRRAGYSLMGIRCLLHGSDQNAELTYARDRWDAAIRGMIADCGLMEEIIRELLKGSA